VTPKKSKHSHHLSGVKQEFSDTNGVLSGGGYALPSSITPSSRKNRLAASVTGFLYELLTTMSSSDVTSHFWVASSPTLSSTLLVIPGDAEVARGRALSVIDLYDVDGSKVNSIEVEFPSSQVGIVELEPFATALKVQAGIAHGHLAVTSLAGSRHLCRYVINGQIALCTDPTVVGSRESCFMPVTLGARREHLVALVNTGHEDAEVSCRLFYGSRSPEWSIVIPALASKLLSLEEELLYTTDDKVWEKSQSQAYVRITSKGTAHVTAQVIERVSGDTPELDLYRSVTSWG
jgi:hypothetical protein